MESGPVCRLGNRPRMCICYLCGREYGSKSLQIHIPQCQKKWLAEEEKRPRNERRSLPPQPNAEKGFGNGGARAIDSFNVEAYAAFEQTLEQCPYCQRRFLPKPFKTHQRGCTAAKPAKPAGTGLIKFSLTNRLVPGAVAGSLHGKAKTCMDWGQGSPLEELEERQQTPLLKHRTSSFEWCLQAERNLSGRRSTNPGQLLLKNHLGSRNSFQNSRGIIGSADSGGDKASLVSTSGEIWRSHSKESPNTRKTLPNPKMSASREWFVPAAATAAAAPESSTSSASAATNPQRRPSKSTKAFRCSPMRPTRQSAKFNALQSSHVERARAGFRRSS